jgi:1-deoxy-D-xylulose-5-phosphate synthase
MESSSKETFSSVCGKTLCELAQKDDKICAITAAMCEGTGLGTFAEKFPDRFFDVGIAEEHAMTFSGGLAAGGMKPFFVVYSSFLQRSYDQIIHDAAIASLPVKICVDRAGVVGEDGETHQGLFDVAFLSTIPNMQIYSPANLTELEFTLKKVAQNSELCAVRYPRGTVDNKSPFIYDDKEFTIIGDKSDVAVLTYGREFNEVYAAYEGLKSKGVSITVIKLNKIYPLSDELVNTVLDFKKVYFYEESIKSASVSEHLAARLLENSFGGSFKAVNIDNTFVPACDVAGTIRKFKLDAQSIVKTLGEN